jgi:acetyl esterase/lipase
MKLEKLNGMTTTLPGRFSDPKMTMATDPRTDPRVVDAFIAYGSGGDMSAMPLVGALPVWMFEWLMAATEPMKEKNFPPNLPEIEGVVDRIETIQGVDGNEIELHITQPAGLTESSEPVPCAIHMHGGGMCIMDPANPAYLRWRRELATRGLVCIGVQFRNSSGRRNRTGPFKMFANPFPAGLNDCVSAIHWVMENKRALQVSTVCTTGESGGGNLCISSAMKAASEGVKVDGVYASCPLISNCYDETTPDYGKRFPSIVENEGYVLSFLHLTGRLYTEVGSAGARDGFAWPIHATDEQLRLLPKTIISLNELDTLRDEGIELSQRLTKLGNEGYYKVVKGTVHATEVSLPTEVPEIRSGMLDGIASFARSL